jgi:hypothetical protein
LVLQKVLHLHHEKQITTHRPGPRHPRSSRNFNFDAMTDARVISKLLSTIEGLVETGTKLSDEDFHDYVMAARYANLRYGRSMNSIRVVRDKLYPDEKED